MCVFCVDVILLGYAFLLFSFIQGLELYFSRHNLGKGGGIWGLP
jgi:hypothetical protein